MTRIVQLVNECRECPNRMYESGGEYVCRKVQGANHVPRFGPMPEWCPLPVYPTHGVSASYQQTESQQTPMDSGKAGA